LGTDGRAPNEIWLTFGYNYKFILQDANNATIDTYDDIYGILGTIPAVASVLPTGMILLWSGSIGSIPAGFLLCDGNNSTPDLRNRFVVGAGSTYSVNQTGGSADAIVVSHNHTATSTVTDPGHGHQFKGGTFNSAQGAGPNAIANTTNALSDTTATNTTGITVATTTATSGTSGTGANIPPYYALCYIMKS
jgi:hypothetical protein